MDMDREASRAKWFLFALVAFVASGCYSWGELVYWINGRDGVADVTKKYESTQGGRLGVGGRPVIVVDSSFSEPNGTRRIGTDSVPLDWPFPNEKKVDIRYTPGESGGARLAGHENKGAFIIFGICLAVIVATFLYLMFEGAATSGTRKPRRR